LARRLGGSSGSGCGTPFFPRVLIHFVRLDHLVAQRLAIADLCRLGLEPVPQIEQVRTRQRQFPRQSGRGHALGDAAQDQHNLRRPLGRAGEHGAREGVEHPTATPAAVVQHRRPMSAMHVRLVRPAARTPQTVGVEHSDQLIVARLLVHEPVKWEIHDGPSVNQVSFATRDHAIQSSSTPIKEHEPKVQSE
jgi:hypothetical protein